MSEDEKAATQPHWVFGDVVELRSGGPAMTITSIDTSNDRGELTGVLTCQCEWFVDTKVARCRFDPSALKAHGSNDDSKVTTWNSGDIVELRSGGPAMTVNRFESSDESFPRGYPNCECVLFINSDVQRYTFRPEALKRREPRDDSAASAGI